MGEKQKRYVEAYSRISTSISSGHYFEAITIEESIISDRLASFLEATDSLKSDDIHRQGFASLVTLWKLATKNPGSIWENCDSLIAQVDSWRKERNKYVHGLVKFPNQKANVPTTEDFINGAKKTANDGAKLAKEVSEWRKRQAQVKRKHNMALKGTSAGSPAAAP
jgi:hypothetical protein